MKSSFRLVIFLFVFIMTGLSTVSCFAQPDGRARGEANEVVINIREMGEKMNVPTEEIVFPDGVVFNEQVWGKTHIQTAIADLKSSFNNPDATYLLTESPAPWIILALMEALQPSKVLYLYPRPGGVVLDMYKLKRGDQVPNHDVVFDIKEDADNLFINLNSDRPEAKTLVRHTFDTANLSKVVIPEIPAGKHVFIHGKGMFCVTVCVARNYIKAAKSVSVAARDTDYTCAVSSTDELEVGDVTLRTIPNNL